MWQAEDDDRCSGCGHPRSESFAIENEDAYHATAWVCHACRARSARAAQVTDHRSFDFTYVVARKEDDG